MKAVLQTMRAMVQQDYNMAKEQVLERHKEERRIISGGTRNFHLGGGAIAQAVWTMVPTPRGFQGLSPDSGSEGRRPPRIAEAVCIHCLQIVTAETIKI